MRKRYISTRNKQGQTLEDVWVDKYAVSREGLMKVHEGPFSALVAKDDDYVYAVDSDGKTIAEGEAGVDDASVIQAALDSLTTGRTWKEIVKIIGDFTITSSILLDNYTVLDLTQAKLTLSDNVNDSVIKSEEAVSYVHILNGEINGNKAKQNAGHGISLNGAIGCIIENTIVRNCYRYGIHLYNNPYYCKIINNLVTGCGGSGIAIPTSTSSVVAFNLASGNGGDGIDAYKLNNVKIIGNTLSNNSLLGIGIYSESVDVEIIANWAYGNGQDGIRLTAFESTASFPPRYIIISDNIARNSGWSGIRVMGGEDIIISNNICYNNGQAQSGEAGIKIIDAKYDSTVFNASRISIIGNRCFDNQTTKTQEYGILVNNPNGGTVYVTELISNVVVGNKTAGISHASGTVYRNNLKYNYGYYTEKSGTATFSGDGTTTQFSIKHSLVSTPSKVQVTAMSEDASGDFYVTADATYIYVNYKTAPPSGTDNVKLSWYAEV